MHEWLYLANCDIGVWKTIQQWLNSWQGWLNLLLKSPNPNLVQSYMFFYKCSSTSFQYQTKYTNNSVHHQNSWSSQFCSGSYMFFSWEKLRELWLGISTFVSTAVQNPEYFSFCGQMTFRNYHRNNHQNSLIIFETTSLNFVSVSLSAPILLRLPVWTIPGW